MMVGSGYGFKTVLLSIRRLCGDRLSEALSLSMRLCKFVVRAGVRYDDDTLCWAWDLLLPFVHKQASTGTNWMNVLSRGRAICLEGTFGVLPRNWGDRTLCCSYY